MRICSSCGKKNLAGFTFCQKCGAELAEAQPTMSDGERSLHGAEDGRQVDADDAEEPLVLLLEQGKKLEAIKLYRQRTGVGLAEAKAAVERLQRQEAIETGELEPRLLELLGRGEKIAAIRLYRSHTGASLSEAKAAIEHVSVKHGLAPMRSGCAGVLIAAGLAAGWLCW
ncbi:MAG TPA: zinc-ribbon domain-containing protein [Pirellulales bacterium]